MEAAFTQPQQVRHVHKTGRATADPVGVFLCESFHSRDDQATLGGMIWHVSGHETSATGKLPCLLQSETVSAHQHLHPAIAAQSIDHADPGQVVADALAHADAVGPFVAVRRFVQIVVDTVQTTHEHVVDLSSFWSEFSVAEIHSSITLDADKRTLP